MGRAKLGGHVVVHDVVYFTVQDEFELGHLRLDLGVLVEEEAGYFLEDFVDTSYFLLLELVHFGLIQVRSPLIMQLDDMCAWQLSLGRLDPKFHIHIDLGLVQSGDVFRHFNNHKADIIIFDKIISIEFH